MKEITTGANRTGVATSPIDSKELVEVAEQVPPTSDGSEADAARVRTEYATEAGPIGSVPPPLSLKGVVKAAAQLILDALCWSVDQRIADKDKIAIMGGNYGGYAALVGLTFTPDTFACGVDIVGPSNLVTLLGSIPPYWAPLLEMFAKRVGDPRTEAGRQLLLSRSPLTRVDQIKRPLLIGQGANDPRVKQVESDQIVKAMKTRGIPVTYVLYPDEGHGFARPENRMSFNAIAETFLAQCLGGTYQSIGGDFERSTVSVPVGAEAIHDLPAALPKR